MKRRDTFLRYIREMANGGFLNSEEFKKIEEKVNKYYDGWGLK